MIWLGVADRRQSLSVEIGENVVVEIFAGPTGVRDGGRFRWHDRNVGPVISSLFDFLGCPAMFGTGVLDFLARCRHGRPHADPVFEEFDFIAGESSAWWHFEARIVVSNRLDEQAGIRITRNDRGPAITTDQQLHPCVDSQSGVDSASVVAVAIHATAE